jgi:hypothetical protein
MAEAEQMGSAAAGDAAGTGAASSPADPNPQLTTTVRADLTWRALCIQLAEQGQRPLILPEDLDATLTEAIRLDDFGDSSHLRGSLHRSVRAVHWRGTDGTLQTLPASDPRFLSRLRPVAATSGIEQFTLATVARPRELLLRRCAWTSVPEFIRDVLIDAAVYQHEFLRARLFFGSKKCVVRALLGGYTREVETSLLRPASATEAESVDLTQDPSRPKWPRGPWLGLQLSLPDGLRAWPELGLRLEDHGLVNSLARGASSIAVLPKPAAPGTTATRWQFRVILRPEVSASEQAGLLPRLRTLAEQAVALGAALLPTGTSSDRDFADLLEPLS